MKKVQIITLCLTFLVGLFSGCSEENGDFVPEKLPAGSIALHVGGNGSAQTRTELKGSYSLHHVQQVYAILYQVEGDDTTYVCHQDLNWNPSAESDYAEGVIQRRDFNFVVPSTITAGEYIILCVGLDNTSGTTYGLEMNEEKVPSFCAAGKKLSEAKAILALGKSMNQSELFAGWESFDYTADEVNNVNVELTRRVAGVYAYLKDIPIEIESHTVKYVRLVSGNLPPKTIGLKRELRSETGTTPPNDFGDGEQDASAQVLGEVSMDAIAEEGTNNLYKIKAEYTSGKGIPENTIMLSAYHLPMKAGSNNTLYIQLLDGGKNVFKSFPAVWNTAPTGIDQYKYPVYPNYIYHIGTCSKEIDRPMSLAGDRLILDVQDWTPKDVHTEFPSVPLDASIKYDKVAEKYIYDCINTEDEIEILPSLLQKEWTLTIVSEKKDGNVDIETPCNWLYFELPDGTYAQEYSSKNYVGYNEKNVNVTIRMNDYVEERDYNPATPEGVEAINNDWRRARIVLRTEGSASENYLSIKQYNAITVKGVYDRLGPDQDYACGYSRFDVGVERSPSGEVTNFGTELNWGFWGEGFVEMYKPYITTSLKNKPCYNGMECYALLYDNNPRNKFPGSAVDKAYKDSYEHSGTIFEKKALHWYLPSWYELYSFFDKIVRNGNIATNICPKAIYWSATGSLNDNLTSENRMKVFSQRTDMIDKEYEAKRRDNGVFVLGRLRQAHKFKDYTE